MKGDVHWLKEVQQGGRVVILDDESIWEIAPSNAGDTCTWDLVSGISIHDGKDPAFPYRLANTVMGESVSARQLERQTKESGPSLSDFQRMASSSSTSIQAS